MQKNDILVIVLLILASKCFSLNKIEILNDDFINSKCETKSQIVQKYLFDNYDESRFETSILKMDENDSLFEYIYYLDEGLLKCLAIYQFPKYAEVNGILLINDERKVSDRVLIELDDQGKKENFVYITWNPDNDYFFDNKSLTEMKIHINDVTKEIFIPIKTQSIDLFYQGNLEKQELEFENYDTLKYLKVVNINFFSNPMIKNIYPFDIGFISKE